MLLIIATCFLANTLLTAQAETSCSVPVSTVTNFNFDNYAHIWYELWRIPNNFEKDYACEYVSFTRAPDGHMTVFNRAYNTSSGEHKPRNGTAVISSNNSFTIDYINDPTWSTEYTVLGVDYSSNSIVAACLHGIERPVLWVFSRTTGMNPSTETTVKNILKSYGYDLNNFEVVPWNDCNSSVIPEQE